jgi:hypothetical protein
MSVITVNLQTGEVTQREMTAEEIASIPPEPPRNIAAEIDALERQHMLPRPVRDSLLAIAEKEAAAAGLTIAQLEAANAGYRKVKQLHQQIAALRALL